MVIIGVYREIYKKNMKKAIIYSLVAVSILIFILAATAINSILYGPVSQKTGAAYIDISSEPDQTNISDAEPIVIKNKHGNFLLTPKAEYEISARVISRKNYWWGWDGEMAPIDLALEWGDLPFHPDEPKIKFSQSNRWYYFKYYTNTLNNKFIQDNSSNHHIIPANENIKKAVEKVKKGDMIKLTGYLVYVDGVVNGGTVYWRSSLSRHDRGNGSCEVMYVEQAQIGSKLYK